MTAQNQQSQFNEAITNMRDNILRSQSQASTSAITGFDSLIEQLKVFGMQINDRNTEILRLHELCKKNNIDFAVPPLAEVKAPKMETPPKPTNTKA